MEPHLTRKEKRIIKNLKESLTAMSDTMNKEVLKRSNEGALMTDEELERMSRTEYLISLTLLCLERFEEAKRGGER